MCYFVVVVAVTKIPKRTTSQVENLMLARVSEGSQQMVAWPQVPGQNIGLVGACGKVCSMIGKLGANRGSKRLGKAVASRATSPVAHCYQLDSTSPLLRPNCAIIL